MSFSGVVCSVSRGVNGVCVCWGRGGSCDCVITSVRALIVVENRDREFSSRGRKSLTSDPSPP